MARIKLGALIQEITGPIGQMVFSKWKGLQYIRYKAPTVTNPNTPEQAFMRANLGASVQEWWNLSDIQRALWEEYAQGKGKAAVDAQQVGSKCIIKPRGVLQSGFNAYVGANQMIASVGGVRVAVPSTLPAPPGLKMEMDMGQLDWCRPKSPPPGFELHVGVQPLVPVYTNTEARLWIKGVWAGSHGYIAGKSVVWAEGESDLKFIDVDTIRMGSVSSLEEIPLEHCMRIKIQVDFADDLGESGPPSECAVTHCLTPP